MEYKTVVPTYNRKFPNILNLAKSGVPISLCVRSEAYDSGYYEHLVSCPNIEIIPIGYRLKNIGETRAAVMEYCYANKIDYAIMLDDTISDITFEPPSYEKLQKDSFITKADLFESCVDRLINDKFSDLCIMFQFMKEGRKYSNMPLYSDYFQNTPLQGYIINVKLAFDKNIRFKSSDVVGFEDAAFFADSLKAGLITCSDARYVLHGGPPTSKKDGGNHSKSEDIEFVNDSHCRKFMDYVGKMYGVYLTKRHRRSLDCQCAYNMFDLMYFNDVLVFDRDENKKIIADRFEIK